MTIDEWLIYHGRYERYAKPIFQRALRMSYQPILNNIGVINYDNYQALTTALLNHKPVNDAYVKVYSRIGVIHGKRIGKEIERSEKAFFVDAFESDFMKAIYEWVQTNLGQRITNVNEYTIQLIQDLVKTSLDRNYTITQMRIYLENQLNSPAFNRMRALRIARTETTTAANYGAFKAGENTDYEMTKEWLSVMDERTRHDHRAENGTKVDYNDKFILSDGTHMMYPGDQTVNKPSQVVNCRCTYNLRAKRDSEGNIIFKQ